MKHFIVFGACICLAFGATLVKEVREPAEAEVQGEEKEGVKGWGRPPYLSPPGIPTVFGNATTNGNVGGLFAVNNSTLTAISGPEQVALASLNATALYYAKPINETDSQIGWGSTNSENLAGFQVTAIEDTSAYAEGDWIQFINHGGSYATGFGESDASGGTYNPGTGGSGWKAPSGASAPAPSPNKKD